MRASIARARAGAGGCSLALYAGESLDPGRRMAGDDDTTDAAIAIKTIAQGNAGFMDMELIAFKGYVMANVCAR